VPAVNCQSKRCDDRPSDRSSALLSYRQALYVRPLPIQQLNLPPN
jgi:hypothetical protein